MLGDALCSFNPIYGQGMTTGALEGDVLDGCLAEQRGIEPGGGLRGFSRRFQRALARAIDQPWLTVTCEDFRYAEAEGKRPPWARLMNWYTSRVYQLTWQDRDIARRFLQVMHLMRGPEVLFAPRVLYHVLALRPRPRPPAVEGPSPLPIPEPRQGASASRRAI